MVSVKMVLSSNISTPGTPGTPGLQSVLQGLSPHKYSNIGQARSGVQGRNQDCIREGGR